MNILGIETSCDETSASIVIDGKLILSNVVSSSLLDHARYGGVIPEIASRRQLELIHEVVNQSLRAATLNLEQIDAVAVTQSPGLIGSLLVGLSFARALAFALQKPLIEVDHIKAHLYANYLVFKKDNIEDPFVIPSLPAIGLVASGGHTSLFYVRDFTHCRLLGKTRDDAVGEAYDKVARLLGLGYPGGPIIDQLAKTGMNQQIRFNGAFLKDSYDFSFSGVKTAVLYYLQKHPQEKLSPNRIAYAFQETVVDSLIKQCLNVCLKKKIKTLLVGGGVAANSRLRERLKELQSQYALNVFYPPMSLCVDNAAMIAGLGYVLFKKYNRKP